MGTVLTTGVFDLLHPGHVALLAEIKATFPIHDLVVGINSDRRAREIKENLLFGQEDRKIMLRAIRYVDRVVVFDEDTPSELIVRLKPDIFVKGLDWSGKKIAEESACREVRCWLVFLDSKSKFRSSELKRAIHANGG